MEALLEAILADDSKQVADLLKADAELVSARVKKARLYDVGIFHWIYVGDTALHLAAAGHRAGIVSKLLNAGTGPNVRGSHRHATPLHYAADGSLNNPAWDEKKQVKTLRCLLDARAEINAQDKNGATPLHRAVRTRCAAAVGCLLDAGADPTMKNKPGSTPFHLAVQNTGRGGSGEQVAIEAQRQIINEFLSRGIKTNLKDAKGKSVLDWARSGWIRDILLQAKSK